VRFFRGRRIHSQRPGRCAFVLRGTPRVSLLLSVTFACGLFIAVAHVMNQQFNRPTLRCRGESHRLRMRCRGLLNARSPGSRCALRRSHTGLARPCSADASSSPPPSGRRGRLRLAGHSQSPSSELSAVAAVIARSTSAARIASFLSTRLTFTGPVEPHFRGDATAVRALRRAGVVPEHWPSETAP
jgi:hypothetical protein